MADMLKEAYEPCDRAIKALNKQMVADFGRLKLVKFDQLNVIREITKLYEESAEKARKRYYEIAFEVYVLILLWNGVEAGKAHRMAENAITEKWVEGILADPDFVTHYSFTAETERKAQRLAEALSSTEQRIAEIDKGMRLWSRQVGQYAINFTDYAAIQAFDDAGIEEVQWVAQNDMRVCDECHELNGKVFRLDEIPPKPHWGCRCFWKAVLEKTG